MQVFDSRHQCRCKLCDLEMLKYHPDKDLMTESALKESETHSALVWKIFDYFFTWIQIFLFISVHMLLSYSAAVRGTCGVHIWFRPPGGLHCSFARGELYSGPFVWNGNKGKSVVKTTGFNNGCLTNRPQDLSYHRLLFMGRFWSFESVTTMQDDTNGGQVWKYCGSEHKQLSPKPPFTL